MWTLAFYKAKGGDIWSALYYGFGPIMCVTYALISIHKSFVCACAYYRSEVSI